MGASSQPRPTASYARRKTSIPLTRLPSGRTPWICPINSCIVTPYWFGSKPAAVMSSVTSRFDPRSNRLRKRISRLHKGHSPSIRTLNGHLSILIHPIPQRSCSAQPSKAATSSSLQPQAGHLVPGFQCLDRTLPSPPSTPRIWPVIQPFRGSANQAIADTTSAGSPILCKGCISTLARSEVSLPVIRCVSGVFTSPGATKLTRIP